MVLGLNMPDAHPSLGGICSVGYLWPEPSPAPRAEPRYVAGTTRNRRARVVVHTRELQCYDIAENQDPMKQIVGGLETKTSHTAQLGVELEAFTMLPGSSGPVFRSLLPEVTWIETIGGFVPELRLVKEPDELASQRQAGGMAESVMLETLDAIRPGMSEVPNSPASLQQPSEPRAASSPRSHPWSSSGDRSALVPCPRVRARTCRSATSSLSRSPVL